MINNFQDFVIDASISIREAMSILENLTKERYQSLYVVEQGRLIGTLSSSDIRRELISHDIATNDKVISVINKKFTAFEEGRQYTLEELTKLRKFYFLPVVNQNFEILKFEYVRKLIQKKNKVVLMAGGLGSRLKELTVDMPKPMLKIGTKPILEIIVEQFCKYNFNDFYISVNYKPESIMNYFGTGDELDIDIKYLREHKRLGTAGCLSLIEETIKEPIFLMNGDILTNVNFENMLDFHIKNEFAITIAVVEHSTVVPYGVIEVDNDNVVKSIKEKPSIKSNVSAGIYILNPELINLIPKETFFDITSLFEILLANNKRIGIFQIDDYWMDIGSPENFHQANDDFSNIFSSSEIV